MDSTKSFIDAWMNTQTKMVDNLMDTSKKIQESFENTEVVEKSVELYSKWFDKQKSLADSMLSILKEQLNGKKKEENKDLLTNWVETQIQMSKQWMNIIEGRPEPKPQDAFSAYTQGVNKLYEEWSQLYGQMFQKPSPTPNLFQTFSNSLNPNNLHQFINNTRTYMKMYELWQPIYKMMQSNTVGMDSLNKIMDIEKYKDVLDGIFHFMDASKTAGFLDMMQKFNEIALHLSKSQGSQAAFIEHFQGLIPTLADKNIATLSQISEQFSEQFTQFIDPKLNMMPAGREKEMMQITMLIQDQYLKYYVKGSEMQNLVYTVGFQAMEKSVQQVMQQIQESNESTNFDKFYNTWVNQMEEEVIDLFGSDAYSKLQGELLKSGMKIKGEMDKLMEQLIAPMPVVPRSEMDEVNATIYELKNKVRSLEKKLKESDMLIAPEQA